MKINYILQTIAIILVIDVLGFLFWIASGQLPADNFYIGSITSHILSAVML